MKLPDFEYAAPVQDSSQAPLQVDQARRQGLAVVEQGIAALGREMLRTQAQSAATGLHLGMAADQEDLAKRPTMTAAQVRSELGADVDSLPEGIRRELTRQVRDPASGGLLEVDREDVPTYLVAGAIFRKRAQDRVLAASQGISSPGWRAEFEAAAQQDVGQQTARLGLAQAHAMVEDLKVRQKADLEQLVRGRAFDRALTDIDASQAFTPGEKAVLREQVLATRQRLEADTRENQLLALADQKAREIEAAHPDDPQGAMKVALAIEGPLGAKVAQRLNDRDRLRTEAQNDELRERAGRLELGVRSLKIRQVAQLESLEDYKRLPDWKKADVVGVLNTVNEQQARVSQLQSDKEWQQELSRFQGLTDREKVQAWPMYQARVPPAYQGGFAQAVNAATTRLSSSWDTEDVQKTFDVAIGSQKMAKPVGDKLRERGRRWYDAETLRNKGIPPTKPEAEKWLAEQLMLGDENGDDWFGGDPMRRFQAEERAAAAGTPLRFVPYSAEKQKYFPAAEQIRARAPEPAAERDRAPVSSPAAGPAPAGQPRPVKSIAEALALPKGTRFIDPDGIERVR